MRARATFDAAALHRLESVGQLDSAAISGRAEQAMVA
jgi:hypothetical protein